MIHYEITLFHPLRNDEFKAAYQFDCRPTPKQMYYCDNHAVRLARRMGFLEGMDISRFATKIELK